MVNANIESLDILWIVCILFQAFEELEEDQAHQFGSGTASKQQNSSYQLNVFQLFQPVV
jgi:hypothetical protein